MKRLFLTILLFGFCIPKAAACSCSETTPSEAFQRADIVFIGVVTKFEIQGEPGTNAGRQATFHVQNLWKGPQNDSIIIATANGGGDCGFDFIAGREYLVYAQQSGSQWHAGICSRTSDIRFSRETVREDLEFLHKETGKIYDPKY